MDKLPKVQIPNPFSKKTEGDAAAAEAATEGAAEASNPVTDLAHKTGELTVEAAEKTMEIAEKTVQAVDPLHLFDPSPIPIRLILAHGLFDRIDPDPYPILAARSNDAFHDLVVQGKDKPSDEVIMQDASTKKPVLVLDRTLKPRMYDIYKTSAMVEGQAVAKTENGQDFYLRAKVLMSDKDFQVFMEGQDEPTYTITKAPGLMNFSTNKVIKMAGEKDPVASTSNWEEGTYMLEIKPDVDAGLMLCLAIISDDNTE